ncbi:PREDICTED: uncharacterized protein LOC109482390 isoform X1 [Branchiostoma belcheri]|uniref:Uncharacterized protein LOC109482390 isoform X1 n=1 Tax=Branchiostoma belcheri TaxID=7741 RepID=A0A6P4ZUT4_BRABE|nr:PREDICTED: uncharacterized protein LOC109482390 isoform X1 [Branchiostoma belcheri]
MATASEIAIPQSAEDIAPSWVQEVLQKDLPGVSITDVHVKGSISQFEGFLSDIIAFDAVGIRNGASQRYSLVAKLTDFKRPLTVMEHWTKDLQIKAETNEVKFYSEAIPEFLSVAIPSKEQKSKRGNEDDLFLPKCYFAATDPSSKVSVRVMENLKSQGFSIKVNRQSLSRDEMMLAAGALAQVHGLSHRVEIRSGVPLPEKFDWITTLSGAKAAWRDVTSYVYQQAVTEFATAFPDQADLVARLEKLGTLNPMEADPRPRLKVLSHAECWNNNIMFKYAEDVPTDVRLVDWQTPRYLPPTYDLTFLFLCNASWDVFHDHRDAILAHYHHKLMETLGPNDQDLLRILQEIKEWGVI